MKGVKIYYDNQGDILEVQFDTGEKDRRTGIGLTDRITLFCDTSFTTILGFTIVAYSKLLSLPDMPLSELEQSPKQVQEKIKKLLTRPPMDSFVHLVRDQIGLENIYFSELVAA
ncbi:hypothetical protein KJ693_05230 [bacterium]|nr:hypothetical protein [bacterium]MBU1614701.1 hypothetical protein [bacterium]